MTLPSFVERRLYLAAKSLVSSAMHREIVLLRSKLRACETDLAQSRAHVAAVRQVAAHERIVARRRSA